MKQRDNWLDDMPHKDMHWHPLYDTMRGFSDDVTIGMEIQVKIARRMNAIKQSGDESAEVLTKCEETWLWLDQALQ